MEKQLLVTQLKNLINEIEADDTIKDVELTNEYGDIVTHIGSVYTNKETSTATVSIELTLSDDAL